MIKRQLNPLRIGKGLLCLLALFMMLLAPQGAWAQTDYGLTVAGVPVTSTNANNITGGGIMAGNGAVMYDNNSRVLTLNKARLNGRIVWNNPTDLTISLVGDCSIGGDYPSSDNPVIKGNGGALLFTTSETTPGSLSVGVTSEMSKFANGWNSSSSTAIWTVDSQGDASTFDWWANQGCDYMTIAPNKKYNLKVNGTQFSDAWCKEQDHNAVDPDLTITDGNTLHIRTKTDYAIISNMPALTVAVKGSTSLSSIRFEASDQATSGTLTITKDSESNYSMNSLSLKNTKDNLATISGFSTVSVSDPMTLKTPSETPTWDSYTGDVLVSDFVSYDITVNGEIVSDKNAGNVLGDNSGSVTYDAETNTLTLSNLSCDNSYSEEPFIKNGHGDLIIYLKGESNFVWNSSVFIAKDGNAAEDYTVTFTTIHDNPSRLTFRSSDNVFSTGHQVVYNDGLVLDVSDIDSDYHTYDMTISSVEYDLTVAGVRVNSSNASDVLSNGTVSYDSQANKLTLNGAEISSGVEAPGIDYTGTDNLTISFSGTNSIAGTGGCSAIRYNGESQTPPTLTFESSSTSSALTLTGTSESVIQNFGSVLGVNGINDATGNSLALTNGDVKYDATNGLYTGVDPITPVVSATIASVYGLVVGGVLVHAGNASNVMGNQGTPTVVFDESTNTLTLNGASLTDPIKSNLDNLIIKLKGNNSIVETSDSATLINSYKKTATLSFDVDNELGGSLTLTNRGDGATIKIFASVSLAEGLYIHSNQAGLRYETINNEKCYVAQQNGDSWTMTINQNASYPIWVYKNSTDGYVQVTETNKANILGEQAETKTVTYNGGTLTLNGATINSGSSYAFVMGDNMTALNVVLVGENTVAGNGFQFTSSSASLTFKTNGTDAGSLAIIDNDGGYYFSSVASEGSGNVPATISCDTGLAYHADTKTVGLPSLGLTIGNTVVTSANKDDVFDGDENLDGKVSFNPQNNTLTLNDANLQTSSLVSTLSNLKVKFNNGCHLKEIVSNNSDATLSFELADNSEDGSYICFYSANAWTGFSADPTLSQNLAYMPNDDTKFIRKVFAPIIALEDGKLMFKDYYGNLIYSGDFSAFACHYTIDYVDNTPQQATGVYTSDSNIQLEHPCTVTAWLTYTDGLNREVQGANAVGKFFGFEESEIDGVIGTKVDLPAIIPTIAETDGVTISYEGNVSDNNTKVDLTSQTSVGNTTVIASLTGSNQTSYTLLNSNFSLTVNIVPPAPSISTAEFEGDAITITAAEGLTNPQIYYSWDEEQDGTSYTQTPPTAKNGTLYAWVTIADGGKSYTSSKAEQTFSVKKNIANAYVQMNDFYSDYVTPYTGSAITPEFVVKESQSDDAPTIASTNYDVTYKYKSKTDEVYSDADVIKNVGDYKIVITGKGEAYGGSQEIEFQVEKASVTEYAQWASPAAKEDLTYTGEEQELVTAGTVPTGVTIKYYVAESAEADPYQEDGGWSEVIPKRQEIDTYYIFCKADESENYEAWPAEGEKVYLTVSIERGTATLTATNQISEYTGEPIEYSMDHVTVNPSTISKENVGIDYYMPNSDSPLEVAPTQVGTYIVRFYLEDANYSLGEEEYTATLTITPKNITADMVTLSEESYTYDGSTHTPTVGVGYTVGQTTKTLTGADYDISYQLYGTTTNVENPTDADTYNVVVTGKGNYSGTATKSFAINPASIEDYTVSVDATQTYTYTGSAIRPSITVTIPNVGTLDAANYTVSYENNVNAADENATNKPTVIVTGIGNYTGTTSASYTIGQADLADVTIATIANQVYTGSAIEPEVSVTLNGVAIDDSEYTVSYSNNTAAGEATVTLTSTDNNFSTENTKTATFEIIYNTLSLDAVEFYNNWTTYYNPDETLNLPTGIGAYIATAVGTSTVTVSQISYIPKGKPVLLNNTTTETTTNTSVTGNMLVHATTDVNTAADEALFYGLYNGKMMRVTGTIPAGKNYLYLPLAMNNNAGASQLTIVIDGETTDVNDVRSKMEDVRGDLYDLQGRKVQKPSKKGLYIQKGRKVVNK